jgi:hypothetical protein
LIADSHHCVDHLCFGQLQVFVNRLSWNQRHPPVNPISGKQVGQQVQVQFLCMASKIFRHLHSP